MQLSRLQQVRLREIWKNEAGNFTPWLAQNENISLLADAINLEIEVISKEEAVGPYRADIVCKNLEDDSLVLIENQLESTDHKHLGQLLTYAAGLETFTIIWIAETFTEEHRATLDWLNSITEQNINFFGVEIAVFKIGDSLPAPQFKLVSKPNNWTRNLQRSSRNKVNSDTNLIQLEYWQTLKSLMDKEAKPYKMREPSPTYFNIITWGSGERRMRLFANARDKRIGLIYILRGNNASAIYQSLEQKYKEESIAIFGSTLEWDFIPGRNKQNIKLRLNENDPLNKSEWPNQHQQLIELTEKMFWYFLEKE